jgi:phosphate transport system permease protein
MKVELDALGTKTDAFQSDARHVAKRNRIGGLGYAAFMTATIIGILALATLLVTITNGAFGYVATENRVDPAGLTKGGQPLEDMQALELLTVLQDNISAGAYTKLDRASPLDARSQRELVALVQERIVKPKVVETWSLFDSLVHGEAIAQEVARDHPDAQLAFRNWLNPGFLTDPQSSHALWAGVRSAILGSLWIIAITMLIALPLGVGASIYLEEYADPKLRINRIIQTNINNLAGVPSIIYGMLGLAIFVRMLEPLTSGAIFGFASESTANGRTVLSAGATLALLVLPLIIINSQEAIRAVPGSLRQASYGLGATRWQTIWHHVLPNAVPGILTGAILSVSRAIGETAPLVVIGASTLMLRDPTGAFSKFTAMPIQIWQWTARPQEEFRHIAAAAILVLLAMLLTLNATAVFLRNRYQVRI